MTLDAPEFESDFDDSESSGFRWPFGWGVMLALGWLVFEVTAQPRFGIAVTGTKLMWNDLLTARWWLKRDPWFERRVCMLLLIVIRASAKYAITLMGICIAMSLFEDRGNPFEGSALEFTSHAGGMALSLSMFSGFLITVLAGMSGVRLWIGKGLTESRRLDQFPPVQRGWNQTVWLLLPILFFEHIVVTCAIMVKIDNLPATDHIKLLIVILGPVLLLLGQYLASRRIIAKTPLGILTSDEKLALLPDSDDDWN